MNSIWITESSSQSILNVIRDEGGVVEEGDTMCIDIPGRANHKPILDIEVV